MKKLLSVVLFFVFILISQLGTAGANPPTEKWVKGSEQPIYTLFYEAQSPELPTLVLLNGLTYELESWNRLIPYLLSFGFGVLLYDPVGQGRSLLNFGAPKAPVSIENQADDLKIVLDSYGIKNKMQLVGLSYGGGLAIAFARKYGQLIENAFLLAPYTEPLESQDKWIQQQIQLVRLWQPWVTETDEDLYARFLRQNVFNVFPLAELSILSHPEKRESVFQLIQGIRKFNMIEASQNFAPNSVHLVIAGLDQYIPRNVLERFWAQLKPESRSTKMVIRLSEHKLPEAFPLYTASWIHQVIQQKAEWQNRTQKEDTLYDHAIELVPNRF